MTQIRLTNTRTRTKEDFVPINRDDVRLYLCGPTVYDRAHLGNARPVLVFDLLVRLLRHVYGAEAVTYVRNFTDVDDKINAEAQRRKAAGSPLSLEALITERTDETIAWYHADMDALGALRPDHEPRATAYIAQMIAMTTDLIAKGHAYEAEGHVLFDVRSFPDYGKLSGRSVDDMIAGARVEVAPFKRDPMDFVLWKPSDADVPGWASPWGRGRPGWHIECSAMSAALLGPHFDIHGGGIDLQFPHHENEIAQSCCAHPQAGFANVWLHNEMLQVEGKKMSKSLGNFFTVRDLLDRGVAGEVIRFVMLSTHYRKPMDWTEAKAAEAERHIESWFFALVKAGYDRRMVDVLKDGDVWKPLDSVVDALSNDLNASEAIAALHKFPTSVSAVQMAPFAASLELMGFVSDWDEIGSVARLGVGSVGDHPARDRVAAILRARDEAKRIKDFATADRIRKALLDAGIEVRDTPGAPSSFTIPVDFDESILDDLIL
ncbi:cysteine--tRNA ligase [Paracoccus nototheniae]|uniref:Cysteine--tRNA ligase n=1 Tax=Paracoccus nototheniae TaxID=2489002 RepID=A0ABW4E4C6_9RHOB|nr:cysteine--tRNA ligase [Paracoccus nototheniae]